MGVQLGVFSVNGTIVFEIQDNATLELLIKFLITIAVVSYQY